MKNIIRIATVGLSNVGKTTFINTLTEKNLKTGNFAGSTTEIKEIAINRNGYTVIIYDVPGFTSFENLENELATQSVNFLKARNYDLILHIVNSEFSYFSNLLDATLRKNLDKKILTVVNFPSLKIKPQEISKSFPEAILFSAKSKENVEKIIDIAIHENLRAPLNILDIKQFVWNSAKITNFIDKIALSKIFGIPLFFSIMFFIFWLSFIVGKEIGDFFVLGFDFAIKFIENLAFLSDFIKAFIKSILIGVGTVVGFMPTIVICVSLIGFIEQTGYITRISFLVDKFFEKFSLGGKSLIPLIIGAGCSIAAYMSARMINDPKEKFLTMVIIGFVPCTAKLAVFMLFCIALFGDNAPFALSIIYLGGLIVGLIAAKLIGIFVKNSTHQKTKIELYNYRMPSIRGVLRSGYSRIKTFIKNAATFITIFVTIFAILSLTGFQEGSFVVLQEDQISESFTGMIGRFITPIFAPLDFDFKMVISLITGLIAKEVAISSLAILYSSSIEGLTEVISNTIGFRQAIVYLVFMFFYLPCVSATVTFYREVKSMKKTSFLIIFTTVIAYTFSFCANLLLKAFNL